MAKKVLGSSMPDVPAADLIIGDYGLRLTKIKDALEAGGAPKKGTYADQALEAYAACIRD